MKRYLKVKGNWIDTLAEQTDYEYIYYIDKNVYVYRFKETDDYFVPAEYVGLLEEESDTEVRE